MKKALFGLMFVAGLAHAGLEKDAYDLYDMSNTKHKEVSIQIIAVDDIQTTCNKLRKSEGFGAFPYAVSACSIWPKDGKNTCTIYVRKKTNNDIIGHEVRHCFVGNFH